MRGWNGRVLRSSSKLNRNAIRIVAAVRSPYSGTSIGHLGHPRNRMDVAISAVVSHSGVTETIPPRDDMNLIVGAVTVSGRHVDPFNEVASSAVRNPGPTLPDRLGRASCFATT